MKRILLAEPHGFCSGVRRAIRIAESALPPPSAGADAAPPRPALYCLHELVHNREVVSRLAAGGIAFVDRVADVPEGATLLFSAHGVSPAVRAEAAARRLTVIDATCGFVAKVHADVRRYVAEGCSVFLIGRRNHDEVLGVAGEAPDSVTVVETPADAEAAASPPDPERVAVVTQTTLTAEQVSAVLAVLKRRFPRLRRPSSSGICTATTRRQLAVREVARRVPLVLVLGSRNSANSNRLVDVARAVGADAELVPDPESLAALAAEGRLDSLSDIGLTAGASTPEETIDAAVAFLRARGFDSLVPQPDPSQSLPAPT